MKVLNSLIYQAIELIKMLSNPSIQGVKTGFKYIDAYAYGNNKTLLLYVITVMGKQKIEPYVKKKLKLFC